MKLEENLNFEQALLYLKNNYVLVHVNASTKKSDLVYLHNDKYVVQSSNLTITYSQEDFKSSFVNDEFYLVSEDESIIDPKKDEEYYSWAKKK